MPAPGASSICQLVWRKVSKQTIMPKADSETENLQKELASLAEKCREEQKKFRDSADLGSGGSIPKAKAICRKVLKGHINKVTCTHFSGDSRHAVSGSLDGKLIVWDCYTGNKTMVNACLDKESAIFLYLTHQSSMDSIFSKTISLVQTSLRSN